MALVPCIKFVSQIRQVTLNVSLERGDAVNFGIDIRLAVTLCSCTCYADVHNMNRVIFYLRYNMRVICINEKLLIA